MRKHLTPANVLSTVAVIVVVAGGSAAIAAIPDKNSVDSSKVINETLKSEDLKDGKAVESSDVDSGAITAADIGPNAVGSTEIVNGSVTSSEIADGEVSADEIATNGVHSSEVATSAIGSSELKTGSVGSSEVLDGSLTGDEIADGALDAGNLDSSRITTVGSVMGTTFEEDGGVARNANYGFAEDSVSCYGDRNSYGQLIAGYGTFDGNNTVAQDELYISEVRLNLNTGTVTVIGGADTGVQGAESFHTLHAHAVCLATGIGEDKH
jgi:hypothetical protein